MLRPAAFGLARRRLVSYGIRSYSAPSQKRALNKDQIAGTESKTGGSATDAGGASAGSSGPQPPQTSEGASVMPFAIAGVTAVGGAAYYFDLIPGLKRKPKVEEEAPPVVEKEMPPEVVPEEPTEEKPPEETPEETPEEGGATEIPTEEPKDVTPQEEDTPPMEEAEPPKEETPIVSSEEEPPITEEVKVEPEEEDQPVVVEPPVVEPPVVEPPVVEPPVVAEPPVEKASVEEAIKELMSTEETSRTLDEAHKALRANLQQSLFQDLDDLSPSELKIRVVQLATEMGERTKWEAVRLKEFLAMKEKETAEKFMELMQKQRLEMELLLTQKLREQEDAITRQANAALQQKEDSIQEVLQAATKAQEAEHEAHLTSTKDRLEMELSAKYEVDFANKLIEAKNHYTHELATKVSAIEDLSQKLKKLESALKVSRSFETGSLRAHRMSAAALALVAKLESSEGAGPELAALESVAKENSVIETALGSIPATVKVGVPTLSELQTKFDAVYSKARHAALVPEGRPGLEGQLLGLAFSALKYPPNPDDPTPDDVLDESEYILSRARRHVQLGELERAVEQLDKLNGQTAFTVGDWKKQAMDRTATAKALHVIKLECAVMNESISAGSNVTN